MLKDERISLNTAKLLKEKGFAEGCNGAYTEYLKTNKSDNPAFRTTKGEVEFDNSYFINGNIMSDFSGKNYIQYSAPTQSLVARWLREVHNIQVYAYSHTKNIKDEYRDYVVYVNNTAINDPRDEEFQTYEEAMEFGIFYALNLIQ